MDPISTAELALKLLPLAIDAFGAVSAEVISLRAMAGKSDEELLAHADTTDEATAALIHEHLAELDAQQINIGIPGASAPPAEAPAATDAPATAPVIASSGALVHGQ